MELDNFLKFAKKSQEEILAERKEDLGKPGEKFRRMSVHYLTTRAGV